ncbi:hypothetical protein [Streptomyces sp. NPDC050560]|uniref:DUF7144 family membrane protein n=1 Tax=Streptomyces sp. NPDC050560 TaxID=3365630 RepID=UPI0037955F85
MAQVSTSRHPPHRSHPSRSAWATGGTVFAGVMLLVEGVIGILNGFVGIFKDDVWTRLGTYTFKFDVSSWGWVHLALGIALAVTGLGVLSRAPWARAVAVFFASLALIANFMWLPYQPVWAIVSIGIALFVIWSLLTDRGRSASE